MDYLRRVFGKNEFPDEDSIKDIKMSDDPHPMPTLVPSFDTQSQTVRFDSSTRELVPEQETPNTGGSLTFGYVSNVGTVRDNNEDSAFVFFSSTVMSEKFPDFGVFIIADGMGGHQLGEKASSLAVRKTARMILERLYLPMVTGIPDPDRPPMAEILTAAVKIANETVLREINDGGTTLTIMVLMADWGHFAHVGDSRAYLVTKDVAEVITRDHSLVQRLIELNQLTVEESREHPQRNVLYRAIGQNDVVEVDTLSRRLPANAAVLLCSDGLWDVVSTHQIREVINTTPNPQQAAEKLVALAMSQGSTDNVSAIVIKMPGG